uniref:Uncharacterized protein n=1 Tax=viral metagenome TaxID=1070528 RepID=A0A6C0H853_9ZZZZ
MKILFYSKMNKTNSFFSLFIVFFTIFIIFLKIIIILLFLKKL